MNTLNIHDIHVARQQQPAVGEGGTKEPSLALRPPPGEKQEGVVAFTGIKPPPAKLGKFTKEATNTLPRPSARREFHVLDDFALSGGWGVAYYTACPPRAGGLGVWGAQPEPPKLPSTLF